MKKKTKKVLKVLFKILIIVSLIALFVYETYKERNKGGQNPYVHPQLTTSTTTKKTELTDKQKYVDKSGRTYYNPNPVCVKKGRYLYCR